MFGRLLLIPLCVAALATAARADNIIRRATDLSAGGAESLDPISPTPFYYMSELIYDTLVQPELGNDQPVPGLAVEWSASADLTEWTFTLRDGVKFHNGAMLDANDVVLSYAVQWDAAHPLHVGNSGQFSYFSSLFNGLLNAPPAE